MEGVTGKVEAERQFLLVELLPFAPAAARRRTSGRALAAAVGGVEEVEQADLHGVALGLLGGFHGDADRGQQARAMIVERIESAGTNQRFDGAPVDQPLVGAPAEIEEVLEWPPASRTLRIAFTACSPVPLTAPRP
jgi:hypothetical protein